MSMVQSQVENQSQNQNQILNHNMNQIQDTLATVYLIYESLSWMTSFALECTSISYDNFTACIKKNSDLDQILSFISKDSIYRVQIEPTNKDLVFPLTKVKVSSIESDQNQIRIDCQFVEKSKAIIEAVNQIKLSFP